MQLHSAEDTENVRPQADIVERPASADGRPRRRWRLESAEDCDGPRVTVTQRPSRPFTDLVRLQRPSVTRQNRERVRANAAAVAAESTSRDATVSDDHRLPVHGIVMVALCNRADHHIFAL